MEEFKSNEEKVKDITEKETDQKILEEGDNSGDIHTVGKNIFVDTGEQKHFVVDDEGGPWRSAEERALDEHRAHTQAFVDLGGRRNRGGTL